MVDEVAGIAHMNPKVWVNTLNPFMTIFRKPGFSYRTILPYPSSASKSNDSIDMNLSKHISFARRLSISKEEAGDDLPQPRFKSHFPTPFFFISASASFASLSSFFHILKAPVTYAGR